MLFLDEITLFNPGVLETLRGPLEEGRVRLARSGGAVSYPCRFSLVAAMNPCPCGYLNDALRPCKCSQQRLDTYTRKLSGPLMDRFDMQIGLDRLSKDDLMSPPIGDSSDTIRERVAQARRRQEDRYGKRGETNASAAVDLDTLQLSKEARRWLGNAIDDMELTARGLIRVLRVSRTFADIKDKDVVDLEDVTHAASLRLIRAGSEVAA